MVITLGLQLQSVETDRDLPLVRHSAVQLSTTAAKSGALIFEPGATEQSRKKSSVWTVAVGFVTL